MEPRLISLKLILDALGVPFDIKALPDRKKLQKAIYLAQISGVNLGYTYGYYKLGPYCPSLARDYYSLAEAIFLGDKEYEEMNLRASILEKLEKIKPLFSIPPECQRQHLAQEDWLELIASVHLLHDGLKLSWEDVEAKIKSDKLRLATCFPIAKKKLQDCLP